ncbi:MAG: uncharacterized protein JWQ35_889 [Bacteriovoracaceae bacterium]|nr:uncharacterized protein [Bacteriovoracaceae bacterium]
MRLNYFIKLASLLLFSISLFSELTAQDTNSSSPVTTTKEKLSVQVDPAKIQKLSPEGREVFEYFLRTFEASVERVTDFQIEFPPSAFQNRTGPIIGVSDLFIIPDTQADLRSLAGQKFTPEQLEEIHQDATYRVHSKKFNQDYVWKVSRLMQRGAKNIKIDIEENHAEALYHLTVVMPDTLFNVDAAPLSVGHGASLVNKSWDTAWDLLIGIPQKIYEFSDAAVIAQYNEQKQKFIAENLPTAIGELGTADLRLFPRTPEDVTRLKTMQVIVSFLFDGERHRWEADVAAIQQRIKAEVEKDIADRKIAPEDFEQEIADRLITEKNARFIRVLRNSDLEKLGVGLSKLVADNAEAQDIIGTEEIEFAYRKQMAVDALKLQLSLSFPIKSKMPAPPGGISWLNEELENYENALDQELAPKRSAEILQVLKKAGLTQAAAIYALGNRFDAAPMSAALLTSLQEKQVPLIKRSFEILKSWDPKKWVEKGQDGKFYLNPYIEKTVTSDLPGWRLNTLFQRWRESASTWTYALLNRNLWNGPLGVRSMIESQPFSTSYTVVSDTGQLIPSTKKTATLHSRISWLVNYAAKQRDEFKKRESGVAGKIFARVLLFGLNDIGVGVLMPIAVGIGQPALTIANTVVSLACTTACVLPAGTVALWALNASVFNFEEAPFSRNFRARSKEALSRFFPPVTQIALPLVAGTSEIAVGGLKSVLWHPAKAAIAELGVASSAIVRRSYDATTRNVLINRIGRTVSRNQKYGEHLVEGPGLSSNIYFQVKPDLILLALQAQLELLESERIGKVASAAIDAPRLKTSELLQGLKLLIGEWQIESPGAATSILQKDAETNSKKLAEILKGQRLKYGDLLNIQNRNLIRLKEADLKYLIQNGSALTESYLAPRLKNWSEKEVKEFWSSRTLLPNDWKGLAESILQKTINPEILTSLEATDKSIAIVVETPHFGDLVDGVLKGVDLSDLDKRFHVEMKSSNRLTRTKRFSLDANSVCAIGVAKLGALPSRK